MFIFTILCYFMAINSRCCGWNRRASVDIDTTTTQCKKVNFPQFSWICLERKFKSRLLELRKLLWIFNSFLFYFSIFQHLWAFFWLIKSFSHGKNTGKIEKFNFHFSEFNFFSHSRYLLVNNQIFWDSMKFHKQQDINFDH